LPDLASNAVAGAAALVPEFSHQTPVDFSMKMDIAWEHHPNLIGKLTHIRGITM